MKEAELGRLVAVELRRRGWTVFKLRCDAYQRGLPDFLAWSVGGYVIPFELKVASDPEFAVKALSPGQSSVLRSLELTEVGSVLVFGDSMGSSKFTLTGGVTVCVKGGRSRTVLAAGEGLHPFVKDLVSAFERASSW